MVRFRVLERKRIYRTKLLRSVDGVARFQNNFTGVLSNHRVLEEKRLCFKSMNVKHLHVCWRNVLLEQEHELMTCTQMIGTMEFVSRQCFSVQKPNVFFSHRLFKNMIHSESRMLFTNRSFFLTCETLLMTILALFYQNCAHEIAAINFVWCS